MSKLSFLFVLFLAMTVKGQVLTAATHCLGNCSTCDPLNLAQCGKCDSDSFMVSSGPTQWC